MKKLQTTKTNDKFTPSNQRKCFKWKCIFID